MTGLVSTLRSVCDTLCCCSLLLGPVPQAAIMAHSLHPPLICTRSPGLAPASSICFPGHTSSPGAVAVLYNPGSLSCPDYPPMWDPIPRTCLPPSPSTQAHHLPTHRHPDPPPPAFSLPLRMASPATPAPELELGVIQHTVILNTSLSPPHGIGHQLLWVSSSARLTGVSAPTSSLTGQDPLCSLTHSLSWCTFHTHHHERDLFEMEPRSCTPHPHSEFFGSP